VVAVPDEHGRLLERHHLLAQAAVALEGGLAQLLVGGDRGRARHACISARCRHAAAAMPLSRLKAVIISSQRGTRSCSPRQKSWPRRRSKSATETPCCSTQVK